MTIKVNFAGVGNAVEATIPVEIGSGMVAQSRRTGVRRRGTRRRSTVDPLPLYTEREEPHQRKKGGEPLISHRMSFALFFYQILSD